MCDLLATLSLPTRPKRPLPSLVVILIRKCAILISTSLASAVRHLLCSFKVIDFQHNLLFVPTENFIFKIDIDLSVAECHQFQHQFNGDRASKMATIACNLENRALHFRATQKTVIPEAKTKRVKSWLNHDAFGKQSLREQTHLHKSILPVTSMNLSSCTCFPLALKIVRALHLFVNSFLPHAENTNRNTQTELAYGTHGTHRENKIELASSATPLLYFAACGRAGPEPQCRVSCNTTRALPSRCWSSHNSTHS